MLETRQRNSSSAERRQITILFCDIVGSTALSERVDPEDVLRIMRAYHDACHKHVARMGGYLSRTIGDGILAYFGYPSAHEDDPHRALHAALSIVSEIRRLKIETGAGGSVSLAVRIAVHTGVVVIGSVDLADAPEQMDVFGEVPNIAARLQELARPNSIIIGSETHERVCGTFRCRYLGESTVKGASRPLKTWIVEGALRTESRFDATRGAYLTPIVGRRSELALLNGLWQRCLRGKGQLVLLTGEPGIGKSRLVRAFREAHADEPYMLLFYQCSPFHTNTPFYPIIDQVQRTAGLLPHDKPRSLDQKLRKLLEVAVDSVDSVLPIYRALVSVQQHGRLLDLGARGVKQTVAQVPIELARRHPVLLVVEDAQWIDPTSMDVLDIVVRRLPSTRMLILISGRPEADMPWKNIAGTTSITLINLNRSQIEEMVGKIARGNHLPHDVLNSIVDRTDGNPLYVEEFTKSVLESGLLSDAANRLHLGRSISALSVPATLQDSLMSRLDRLAGAKRTLQEAAVVGRIFTFETLSTLSSGSKEDVLHNLMQLEGSSLITKRGDGKYVFRHAMIRDAAYDSLLKSERQALHRQIAGILEAIGPSGDPGQMALLAHHFSRAAQLERAIPRWLQAGLAALRQSSPREAIAHFREGIDALRLQPASSTRLEQELEFQINLALAYTAIEGWAGPRVEKAYRRALNLTRHHGSLDQKIIVFWGLWVARLVASDLTGALNRAKHLLSFAEKSGNRKAELMANCAAVISNFFIGRLSTARAHAERVCELYDARVDKDLVWTFQHDPKVVALVYLGHLLWLLGEPARARAAVREARDRAERLGHPFMLSFALILGASDYLYERDLEKHLACVERGIEVARKRGLSMFEVFGPLWSAEAIVARDPSEKSLNGLSRNLDQLLNHKMYLQAPVYQALLATQYLRMGDEQQAKMLTDAALKVLKRTGEKWFEPELYRIMGEIAASANQSEQKVAEAHFKTALYLARRMGAVGWELRAARSLAELYRQNGKLAEIGKILCKVCDKYPPGQSCADLRKCRALSRDALLPL